MPFLHSDVVAHTHDIVLHPAALALAAVAAGVGIVAFIRRRKA